MKVTELYIYPIKSLYPLSVQSARLRREGLEHDRRFMLLKVLEDGAYKNIQTAYFPECTLFRQTIEQGQDGSSSIVMTYSIPSVPLIDPPPPEQRTALRVPLRPGIAGRETVDVRLYGSSTAAYRMGEPYDSWFSACFGYAVVLVYIGDQGRAVLAHSPSGDHDSHTQNDHLPVGDDPPKKQSSWFSAITSYISGGGYGQQQGGEVGKMTSLNGEKGEKQKRGDWLTFNEAAPFLLTSKASLRDVSARLPKGEAVDMIKFRPNIVVDDDSENDNDESRTSSSGSTDMCERISTTPSSVVVEEEQEVKGGLAPRKSLLQAWEEDFWAELELRHHDKVNKVQGREGTKGRSRKRDGNTRCRLALTANCARCISINIDYDTGRPATGEQGTVLKKLMRDRRVDSGNKWSPIFGRYAFLLPPPPPLPVSSLSSSGPVTRGQRLGTQIDGDDRLVAEYDEDDVYDGDDNEKGEEEESGEEEGEGEVNGYDTNEDIAVDIAVGDEVTVLRRVSNRDVWSWPKT
ncbi:hypothetical protein F4809DRAFT_207543 [Biscogniauxia mediterranea]|nr:hypothetical protein F4809DRAFT_207543 [Biscogniauxia mediterranea]